ncbi:FAD-binding oxidoreductase [Anatilimnocola aggregata]|uniref:FAD-binding oxidoreductase n=1 Tax=Anatilimnocola aggregata TaxID=2528021 RepID=UPI0011AAECB8|nr:FAD-binding oxidoreductase [Anatilimnocola aggregata]
MPVSSDILPLQKTSDPATAAEVVDLVQQARAATTPLYPIGGGTSLHFGLRAKTPGWGVTLSKLNRVVDFPARDMTITVEAGITLAELAQTLAAEGQRLPVDVPAADKATVGGVIATNWNGPRRYGQGSLRDFVIGIEAVDGTGLLFHGGGRVVKNVAGYDFCKLLTGSLGTLGIITQVTFKVRPIPERSAWLACSLSSPKQAEAMLAALQQSAVVPAAVELLAGPVWQSQSALDELKLDPRGYALLVLLEGTAAEVLWMKDHLRREWRDAGVVNPLMEDGCAAPWLQIIEFSADLDSPITVQASVKPSGVLPFIEVCRQRDPNCSVLAHAGNGTVFVRFATFPDKGLGQLLLGDLQPAASAQQGHVVILNAPPGAEATNQSYWGGEAPLALMTAVKRRFDPLNLLNRGRFVY